VNQVQIPPPAAAQLTTVRDGTVRAGPLTGIPGLLRELGQEPAAVLAAAGVEPHLLDDPENTISFATGGRLLGVCVETTGCAHFGLLLGSRAGLEALGLVGMLAAHSADLGQALHNVVLHLHLHDRGAIVTLTVSGDEARLGYAIYQPGVEATAQIYDTALAIAGNALRTLCGPAWRAREVLFSHARPPDLTPYRRIFGVRPRFGAEQSALVFPAAWLEHPLRGADPMLYRTLAQRIADLSTSSWGDLAAQVRRVTCHLLLCGQGSLESVANVFAVHPRTLNRRLLGQGASFRQLRDECLHALACQYLRDTTLPVAEIAALLDYADAASFTRAFRRWSGTTPAAWRGARQGGWSAKARQRGGTDPSHP
jgi:AraC-like DNA-binding protein